MKTWQDEALNTLLKLTSENELFDEIARIAKSLGFEYCSYSIYIPVPVLRPTFARFSNYPEAWREIYKNRHYEDIDPAIQHGLKSTLPVIWSDELFKSVPDFWQEAQKYGLRAGWTHSSRDAKGTVGILSLARSVEPPEEEALTVNEAKMMWLTHLSHLGMTNLLAARLVSEVKASMTIREKEVLGWTAEGKTAYEIGKILSVAERTVNFHIENVVVKLKSTNKTQAAIKAALLGMLR